MPSGFIYEIRQNNDVHRVVENVGFLNTTPAMVALMEHPGDKILVREAGNARDQVYLHAKKNGRKVGIRKVQIIIEDRVYHMLEVELTAIDATAKNFVRGECDVDE